MYSSNVLTFAQEWLISQEIAQEWRKNVNKLSLPENVIKKYQEWLDMAKKFNFII